MSKSLLTIMKRFLLLAGFLSHLPSDGSFLIWVFCYFRLEIKSAAAIFHSTLQNQAVACFGPGPSLGIHHGASERSFWPLGSLFSKL